MSPFPESSMAVPTCHLNVLVLLVLHGTFHLYPVHVTTLAFVFWVLCLFGMRAYFRTGSCCISLAGLKPVILLPHPPNAGITGVYHHTWLYLF